MSNENKIKKICVVGAGHWGLNHVKALQRLNALGGVVDNNANVRDELLSIFPNCEIYATIEDSFNHGFDGYIVSSPPITHFEIAKKIIKHKKPVLVEKPITLSLKDAMELNKLAKANKVNLMVGHLLLFHPAFVKIKELIEDNRIGEVQYVYSNRLNLGSFRSDENVLWSFAPHDISLFNYFFSESPKEIISSGVDILQEGIHDTSITTFKYPNKKMGHIFVSWLHPFKEHRFIIIGSNGMLRFEDTGASKPLIFYDKTVDLSGSFPKSKLGSDQKIEYDDYMPLDAELKYFISKIDNGVIEIANGDSAVEVMKVLERAAKSLSREK
jgi:UDP-2-acetamido-3-amino-2,3-dideoxy-glucuronate N-acetyltransferase